MAKSLEHFEQINSRAPVNMLKITFGVMALLIALGMSYPSDSTEANADNACTPHKNGVLVPALKTIAVSVCLIPII